jgi:hypothetical protein
MKKYAIIVGIISALVCVNVLMARRIVVLKQDRDRISENFETVSSDLEVLRDENGKSTATIRALTLKTDELEKANSSLSKLLKEQSVKQSEVKTIVQTSTILKIDTVLVQVNDSCKQYKTNDTFIEVCNDNIELAISTDVNVTIYERRKKKFLWWRIGKKQTWSTVTLSNEHIDVNGFQTIVIN